MKVRGHPTVGALWRDLAAQAWPYNSSHANTGYDHVGRDSGPNAASEYHVPSVFVHASANKGAREATGRLTGKNIGAGEADGKKHDLDISLLLYQLNLWPICKILALF